MNRLYRASKDRIFGGVCGGIGKYFDIDPVIIRLIWLLFALCAGFAIFIYIIAWIIIPNEPLEIKPEKPIKEKEVKEDPIEEQTFEKPRARKKGNNTK